MVESCRGVLATARGRRASGRILALDLALRNVGVVILTEDGHPLRCLTISHPLGRARVPGEDETLRVEADRVERLINVANEVIGYGRDFRVSHIAIEGFAFDKPFQAHQLGEIAGVVKTQCWLALHVVPAVVSPSSARKYLFGHGRPTKDQIVEVVRDHIGVPVQNDHEADAYVVGRWMFGQVAKEVLP